MDKESVFGFQILILRGIEEPEGVRLVMKESQLEEGLNRWDILTVVFSKRINAARYSSSRVYQRKGDLIMAIKNYVLKEDQKLTKEQIRMINDAAEHAAPEDDENPELTDEQLSAFCKVHESRQTGHK